MVYSDTRDVVVQARHQTFEKGVRATCECTAKGMFRTTKFKKLAYKKL